MPGDGPLDPIFKRKKRYGTVSFGAMIGFIPFDPLTVTIDQAAGQADPTIIPSVDFDVVFSEAVTGFATGDITLSGTATGTASVVDSGDHIHFTVTVILTASGTVIASIDAAVCTAIASGLPNEASTSTDNTVTVDPFDVIEFSDNFNRATLNPSGQYDHTGGGFWTIVGSTQAECNSGSNDKSLRATTRLSSTAAMFIEFDWYEGAVLAQFLCGGTLDLVQGYTAGYFGTATTGDLRIMENGSSTTGAGWNVNTPVSYSNAGSSGLPHRIRYQIISNFHSLYLDGVLIRLASQASQLTLTGEIGVWCDGQANPAWEPRIDNLTAGIIV